MNNFKKIPENKTPTEGSPANPGSTGVLSRRKYHKAIAIWLSNWSTSLQIISFILGVSVILMPKFFSGWRHIIENTPVISRIYQDFSGLKGVSLIILGTLLLLFLILNLMTKNYPGGWDPGKNKKFPSPRQVVEMNLYPRTRREEFVFFVDILFATIGVTIWMFFLGVVAFFLNKGV